MMGLFSEQTKSTHCREKYLRTKTFSCKEYLQMQCNYKLTIITYNVTCDAIEMPVNNKKLFGKSELTKSLQ